jgi:CHAD domain-containing protein
MKARKVKGLDPDGTLADNLQRIVAARLDELASFVPKALDPAEVKALHDLRIAAKRLRDVQLPRVRALHDELRAADALEARARAGQAPDLDPTLASGTPHSEAWRGLETLAIYLEARRGLLFERFLELWRSLERDGFRARLQYAIAERPIPVTPASQAGNGAGPSAAVPSPETDG